MDRFVQFIRNYQGFCATNAELQKFGTILPVLQKFGTVLPKLRQGFVVKSHNLEKFPKLKKVLYGSNETIFLLPNLKSFRRIMRNLKSSVKYLFFSV